MPPQVESAQQVEPRPSVCFVEGIPLANVQVSEYCVIYCRPLPSALTALSRMHLILTHSYHTYQLLSGAPLGELYYLVWRNTCFSFFVFRRPKRVLHMFECIPWDRRNTDAGGLCCVFWLCVLFLASNRESASSWLADKYTIQ